MKVFVFGAGASKGSQTDVAPEQRAPLVNDLFDPNYFAYANLAGFHGGDMVRFRQAMSESGGSLEAWLTQKWESIEGLRQEVSKQAERGDFGRLTFYIASLLLAISTTYREDNGYSTFALKLRARDE